MYELYEHPVSTSPKAASELAPRAWDCLHFGFNYKCGFSAYTSY